MESSVLKFHTKAQRECRSFEAIVTRPAARFAGNVAAREGVVGVSRGLHRDRSFQRRDQRTAADRLAVYAAGLRPGPAEPERSDAGGLVAARDRPVRLPGPSGVDPRSDAGSHRALT